MPELDDVLAVAYQINHLDPARQTEALELLASLIRQQNGAES